MAQLPPTIAEVTSAIKKLKNGKVRWDYGIFPDYVRCLPPSALEKLQRVIEETWISENIPD